MAMIKISRFDGMIPKLEDRSLPETNALLATNVKLTSTTTAPINTPSLSYTPQSPKTSPSETLFIARSGLSSVWFTWMSDVDCVRVPLSSEVESRFCWSGDGAPKMAKYSTAITGAGNNYPAAYFDLGIPTPQTKPTVAPSGGVGAAVTRFYCYTFFSQDGEESGSSPISTISTGKIDDTWALSAMDTAPTNSGAGTASSTTFTNTASAKHWLRVGDEVAFGSAPTVFRTVTAINSAAAFSVTGASIAAETTWARRANWNVSSLTRRIYRTSGTTAQFLLVVDNLSPATTTYNDTIIDANLLGDELVSVGWEPPPVGLKGLCVHASGALAGFVNNIMHFSEPLQPHAWITANTLSAEFDGVGMQAYGSTVVLCTKGSPFIATGVEPSSMTGETLAGLYPCMSKRSVIGLGDSILYASAFGLVRVGSGGVTILTDQFYTKDEWVKLTPTQMICAAINGRVYVRCAVGAATPHIQIFDGPLLTTSDVNVHALYSDTAAGELYLGMADGINLWDPVGGLPMQGQWWSKEFVFPKPVNLGAAKVDFDTAISPVDVAARLAFDAAITAANIILIATGKVHGGINTRAVNAKGVNASDIGQLGGIPVSNAVIFNLHSGVDRLLIATRTVHDTKVFRLPAGIKIDSYYVEVLTQTRVKEIRVAETPNGLRAG